MPLLSYGTSPLSAGAVCGSEHSGGGSLRYAITILGAMLVAVMTVFVFSTVDSTDSEAAVIGAYVTTCDGGQIYLNAQEKRTLQLHNETRASRGLRPFCVHPALTNAARAHSQEMMNRDYLSHNSYNGENAGTRLKRFGYNWFTYGENVSWGSGRLGFARPRFDAWMNSTGHRANILNGRFREIGIGTAFGNFRGNPGSITYTVDFGTRR